MPNATWNLRRTAAAFAVLAALIAGAPGASADPSPEPAPPPSSSDTGKEAKSPLATFGVRPATAKAPDDRPNFSYASTPGAVIKDFIAVSNISQAPVQLRVYPSDAYNTDAGGFDLLASNRRPVDVGSWVRMRATRITIPARSVQIVPFTLTVPGKAEPGDHVGGIVAALTTKAAGPKGQKVTVEQRVGARVYLRVAGPVEPGLTITDIDADYDGSFFGTGTTKVRYTVRNTGNVRLGGEQKVTVGEWWSSGRDAEDAGPLPELLPGNQLRMTATVPGLLPSGWLDGTIRVKPIASTSDPGLKVDAVTAEFTVTAVPWPLVVLLALLAAYLLWRRYVRRPNRGDGADASLPDTPQPSGEPAEKEPANA